MCVDDWGLRRAQFGELADLRESNLEIEISNSKAEDENGPTEVGNGQWLDLHQAKDMGAEAASGTESQALKDPSCNES